jgi:hypothetical protein
LGHVWPEGGSENALEMLTVSPLDLGCRCSKNQLTPKSMQLRSKQKLPQVTSWSSELW